MASESDTDFMIEGEGFFALRGEDGNTYYTRNGSFQFAIGTNGYVLENMDGLPVLSTNGQPITLNRDYILSEVTVDKDGRLCYPDENENPQPLGISIGVFQFNNPSGLNRLEDTLYAVSDASGQPINEATNNAVEKSKIHQGYLEGSNVQVVDEMVSMIVAQRAYELNSKAITTSDEMLQQANNLKR